MSAKSTHKKSAALAASGSSASSSSPKNGVERASKPRAEPDVAVVCGISDDGQGIDIIRKRGERIEAGTVRRLEQGKPIHGEIVRLRPRENAPLVCDVEVEVPAPTRSSAAVSSGPAQVATETYRKNWDAIYGRKPRSMLN